MEERVAQASVSAAVSHRASLDPARVALRSADGECVSYGQLHSRALRTAGDLTARWGVGSGDAVVLSAVRGVEFIVAYLAVHHLGAVAVPLAPDLPQVSVREVAERLSARVVLSSETDYSRISGGIADAATSPVLNGCHDPNALADVIFTSGTTGRQKAVMLSHHNLMSSVANINGFVGTCASDVEVVALPLSHSFGLGRVRCCLVAGATVAIADGFARPKQLFSMLDTLGATGFSMVPAAWRTLQRLSGDRLGRFDGQLRYVELGSASMSPGEKRQLAELLPNTRVIMHYGLTEASRAAFLEFGRDHERLDTVGRAGPMVEIGVFSHQGERLSAGMEGEICVRGPMVTLGYLGDPASTAGAFIDDWFRTGDFGAIDETGYVTLRGRVDEMINVGGRKVAPVEIEEALLELDVVADVACVGMADPISGHRVKAFVCWAAEPLEFGELVSLLRSKLEPYKMPAELETVVRIPRTASGKVQRLKLVKGTDS